jgi:hypothetical protein
MQVTTKTSSRRIADMFVGAIEGGSNYWCSGVYLVSPGDVAPDDKHEGPWYDNPRRYEDPDLKIKVVEDEESVAGAGTDHIIGLVEIAKGLAVMAEKYPAHFADIVNETDDAATADLFLQCVALGEEVYA